MSFENLSINRIIIHEIFRRVEKAIVPPDYGTDLLELPQEARDALQERMTEALGKSSHGVEMEIRDAGNEDALGRAKAIIACQGNDAEFIALSRVVAEQLAEAQTSRQYPGGIVVVIEGTCGNPARPMMCIIKAEPHAGFTKRKKDGRVMLEYLKELILTPQSKLYKIGAFICENAAAANAQTPAAGWRAFLFDELITRANKLAAAQYFYETFLGLQFPTNSAFQTKTFHSLTKDFIRESNLLPEKKIDLLNALTTYLKADQGATIQVNDFSTTYLDDPVLQDSYTAYMERKNFPTNAIHKDLSEVQSQLKLRKLTFSSDIKLTAPADQFENLVRIDVIDGDQDEHGHIPKWTRITVRDRIRDQE